MRWLTELEQRARKRRSPSSYLDSWPTLRRIMWFCLPELRYCGAEPGSRCACGSHRDNHDSGDE